MPGQPCTNSWEDIPPIHALTAERLGYPTQKPEALLERIIKASSNEGDVVLDPFCGCGTAIAAAQKLKRRWIGVDITHLAIGLIKQRLQDSFGREIRDTYDVIGEPTDFTSAQKLATEDRHQFQAWALGLVGARRAASAKKGADHGIDGKLFFRDGKDELKQIILSVKSGGVQVRDVRDLVGTIEREKAEIGVLLTLEEPSKPMLKEAVDAGFFKSENFTDKVPRVQILTIEQLLEGKHIQFPRVQEETFKQAPKAKGKKAENMQLPLE
jgi:SAM-dependent methyltransferase